MEHPSLTKPLKPMVILDNKTLAEVKAEVTEYANKLSETIKRIEENAGLYEKDTVKAALHETLREEYTDIQNLLAKVLMRLDKLDAVADAEIQLIDEARKKLETI